MKNNMKDGTGFFVGCKSASGFVAPQNRYNDLTLFKANSVSLLHLDGFILAKDLQNLNRGQVFLVLPTQYTVSATVSDSVLRGSGFASGWHCTDGSGGKIYRLVPATTQVRD